MAGTGNTSIRTYRFFRDQALAGGGGYVDNGPYQFVDAIDSTPFVSIVIKLSNDSGNDMWFSFDGVTDHGRVPANSEEVQQFRRERRIWLRGTAAGAYRLSAW